MKTLRTIPAALLALALTGCATTTAGSDSYCVARAPNGRCTGWQMGPSRQQTQEYERQRARQAAPAPAPQPARKGPIE